MAGLSNAGRNAMLTGFVASAATLSMHTADPGATGANEVTGGSPAYARQPLTWGTPGTPTAGHVYNSALLTFDIPAGTTITHGGYWTAGGAFLGSRPLDTAQTYSTQGTYTIAVSAIDETVT